MSRSVFVSEKVAVGSRIRQYSGEARGLNPQEVKCALQVYPQNPQDLRQSPLRRKKHCFYKESLLLSVASLEDDDHTVGKQGGQVDPRWRLKPQKMREDSNLAVFDEQYTQVYCLVWEFLSTMLKTSSY